METEEEKQVRLESESQNSPQGTDINELFKNTLIESNQRAQASDRARKEMEDKYNELLNKTRQPEVVSNSNKITNETFWADPVTSLNTLIQQQIAPLSQTAQLMQQREAYDMLKRQYRTNPAFAQIEGDVDRFMNGLAPTHENIIASIERAIGRLVAVNPGILSGGNNNNQNNNQNNNIPVDNNQNNNNNNNNNQSRKPDSQAHLRPSNNSPSPKDSKPPRRALTENERKVIRITMNGDEEAYWKYMEAGSAVDSWKPEKK